MAPLEGEPERRRVAYERSACPREHFASLRKAGPTAPSIEADGGIQLLHRPEIERALKDWSRFSSDFGGIGGSAEPLIPLNVDPPLHTKYRRILDPYFGPKRMQLLAPVVGQQTADLIDSFIDRGRCDFSAEIAVPLPCTTFLALFGLPLGELADVIRWKDIFIRPESVVSDRDAALKLQADTAMEIYERFAAELSDRRKQPRDDLITHLADVEIDGERLTDSEIMRICFLMLAAGLDTVTISLECIFAFLAVHDDARRMLVTEPGSEVNLVEELLRWETPVLAVARRAAADVALGDGTVIPRGTPVSLMLGSANTDPDGLPGADILDFRRRAIRSLAFGGGPHHCLGSHLARMELRTIVRVWHDRIPEYSIAPGAEIVWNSSALRGVDSLPLAWPVATAR